MAFGPATPLLQQAILTLLQGRGASPIAPAPLAPAGGPPPVSLPSVPLAPAPAANVPMFEPSQVTEPPEAPLDTRILAQILAAQGPPPTPPAPLGLRDRIANALIGFGAGVQGQGPQFLAQLAAPRRRYEAQLADYNANQSRLKQAGTEIMLREREGRTRRAQEVSDRQFEQEFARETRRLNLTDAREQEMLRDALLSRRQREDDERQAEENRRKEEQQTKIKLAELASKYRAAGAKGSLATELAQKDLDPNFKLSPAAEKWFSARVALEEARAARAARPAGSAAAAAPKVMVEIKNPDGTTSVVPFTAQVSDALTAGMITQGPRGVFMGGQQPQPATAPPSPSLGEQMSGVPAFSEIFGAPQQQQAGQVFTRAQIEAHARKTKRDPKTIEADLRARGFQVQ